MTSRKLWRISTGIVVLAYLPGCDAIFSPEIEDCEGQLVSELRAPSTYKRIETDKTVMEHLKPAELWVSIKYDASNAFGTPIRGEKICRYALVEERADLDKPIDMGAPLTGNVPTAEIPNSAALGESMPSKLETHGSSARTLPSGLEPPALVHDENSEGDEPVTIGGLCWEGYCPCEPPQGGPDQLLCDALRRGDADPKMLSVGKSMRETRRQISEYQF